MANFHRVEERNLRISWNKETKKREINEFEAAVVRDIFERVASGESIISIAQTMNQHNVPTKAKNSGIVLLSGAW